MNCSALKPTISHIIGSAFSQVLSSDESPVVEGGVPLVNTSGWGVSMELVPTFGGAHITVAGSWLSSVAPFKIKCEQADTSGWGPGLYEVRIHYVAPDTRLFKVPTNLTISVAD